MKNIFFSPPIKKSLQVALLLAILLFSLSPIGTGIARAIACYNLTLTANPVAGGTVDPSLVPDCTTQYFSGDVVGLTGSPNPGYLFGAWSGDLTGFTNPSNVTMNADKSVTAIFIADTWQNAIDITSIPFAESVDTTSAKYEPTDEAQSLNCAGVQINGGLATVWYKYTPAVDELVSLDTLGSSQSKIIPGSNPPKAYPFDTYIAVWKKANPSQITIPNVLVGCNDDNTVAYVSQLGFNAVAGTTYYIQVAEYNGLAGSLANQGYNGGNLQFHVGYGSQTDVYINGTHQGLTYTILPKQGFRPTYALDSGPVKVISSNSVPLIAALRDAWLVNGQITSFAQMMGLPKEQLSDTYWFPAYNNLTLSEQIRFANVDTVATTVTVNIGGVDRGSYPLNPNQGLRVTYALDSGPVKVSSTGQKIIASMRDAWSVNGIITSFTELMGLPKESLSDTYIFPAYNNVTLDGQLRFANVDTVSTNVTVTIGGVDRGTYPLAAGASQRVAYAVDSGPVQIKSDNGAKLIAALRDAWLVSGQIRSYAQLMGMPKEKLSDTYLFPAYNNVTLNGQLRFANVDTVATTVTVTIGGVVRGSYPLNASVGQRVTYAVDSGPVEIKSSGGAKIIAAIRDAWQVVNGATTTITSFVQMMGLPKEALSTTFWFPGYNNVTLSGQLRIAVP